MFSSPELHTSSDSIQQTADVTINLMDLSNCGLTFSFYFPPLLMETCICAHLCLQVLQMTSVVITEDSIYTHSLKF